MEPFKHLPSAAFALLLCSVFIGGRHAVAQAPSAQHASATAADDADLRETVRQLAARVTALEDELRREHGATFTAPTQIATNGAPRFVPAVETAHLTMPAVVSSSDVRRSVEAVSSTTVAPQVQEQHSAPTVLPTQLPGGATLNYDFDGYYDYDFEHPIGRVQYLRAYDVLSNAFSINQAGVIFALDPDVDNGRRYGVRFDLQFGQATETLQGNPANETRPEIYRNIFQAYGTYVVPVGKGLNVDVGKWASSLGIEGNYTKDQINYSRSFYFNYLPFYHAGVRTSYKFNDKITANYWLVNGTDQSEPTNSFKDELFGIALQPAKSLSWTINYYLGQDHPDVQAATGCAAPVQPGLCLQQINPAPNGKLHIIDSYATWNATPKLALSLEGDYVIEREWATAAPGESSAPSRVDGGAAYIRYQWRPKMALAARSEYLSDRGGLFSGTTQALKEFTGTYEYKFGEGFLARVEYRQDWSNVPFFLTNKPGVLSSTQPTLTIGTVWWLGGKQGPW